MKIITWTNVDIDFTVGNKYSNTCSSLHSKVTVSCKMKAAKQLLSNHQL